MLPGEGPGLMPAAVPGHDGMHLPRPWRLAVPVLGPCLQGLQLDGRLADLLCRSDIAEWPSGRPLCGAIAPNGQHMQRVEEQLHSQITWSIHSHAPFKAVRAQVLVVRTFSRGCRSILFYNVQPHPGVQGTVPAR